MSNNMSSSDIMEKAKHEDKDITIVYMDQGNEIEEDLKISPMKTVSYLKDEIEKIFNLSPGTLEGKKLRMKKRGQRTGELLDDDNKTLFDYRIKNGAKIIFTILENF
jgi:uncharacterized ubiquitin-like protein YukD